MKFTISLIIINRYQAIRKNSFLIIIRNNDWRSLKAKIFLRSDLYNADVLHFMDASKIKAYLLDLSGCTNHRKD